MDTSSSITRRCLIFAAVIVTATCSVSVAQNKPRRAANSQPITLMVRKVIEDMTRAIEAYESAHRMREARPHIARVQSEMKAVSLRMSRYPTLAEHLNDASSHFMSAEYVFQVSISNRKMGEEEAMAFTEMVYMNYECPDGSIDACIQIIMNEARKSQRLAFEDAVVKGFYTP